jgi:hypothetical protein
MNFVDHEEIEQRHKRKKNQRNRDVIWNILTGSVLIVIVILIGSMVLIFSNPVIALNPFPPPTMPVLVILPSATPTNVFMPATWTPAAKPTETPRPVLTPTIGVATPPAETQPVPTFIPTSGNALYPFTLEGQPIALANIVFRPENTCNWQGVAGRVVDLQGRPVVGTLVRLKGTYNGKTIELTTLTGGSLWYGESGYEFKLGDKAISSSSSLAIQLNDQSFLPISDRVIFDTYATCDQNLIMINFKQIR